MINEPRGDREICILSQQTDQLTASLEGGSDPSDRRSHISWTVHGSHIPE